MADPLLKNIPFEKVLELTSLVSYQEGQIVSRTLAQNKAVSVTLFAFDAGEEISTHASHGDAMVSVLDGTAQVTIGGNSVRSGGASGGGGCGADCGGGVSWAGGAGWVEGGGGGCGAGR